MTNCRKNLGSFADLHCAWLSPPLASFYLFPPSALDKRVLSFPPLLLYRLRVLLQQYIQHQQWHAFFQQRKGKNLHVIWKNIGNGRERTWIDYVGGDLEPFRLQWDCRLPQNTTDTEMCQCNRCRGAQAGSAHGSLGLPGSMRAAQILLCWWHRTTLSLEMTWPHLQAPQCKPSHFASG